MATAWDVASAGWAITVLGWLLSPIITLILPNILSGLGFDAAQKVQELEISIMPELENKLHAVDLERMMQRGKKSNSDVAVLDKMAAMLRHAREDAQDIFDDAHERIDSSDILDGVDQTFKKICLGITRIVQSKSACLLQCAGRISLSRFFRRASREAKTISAAASNDPSQVTIDVVASHESVPVTASTAAASHEPVVPTSDSTGRLLSCFWSSFDLFKYCCTSTFNWLCFYRDWSYKLVGATSYQENATALDFVLTAISRSNLKKRIEKVETTLSEVTKSPLLATASKSAPDDIANKNRSRIRTASKRKVFGREGLRDHIMVRLREIPEHDAASSSDNPCYSVIGIYGVAGSGKTTFAGYIRDYIKEECKDEKLFDTVMCIHVTKTFSVDDIFHEMLKDITKYRHSNITDRDELKEKLKESLCGKRFFLILDDLWVENKNDQQLEELISPLDVGIKGSKILVTARTKVSAKVLSPDATIKMPDLEEDQYILMFTHYALGGGASDASEDFISVGREIAKRLHRSPIAAVTVAGRLGANRDISFWKTANHEMFNENMDALWWSYQQLNPDIKRCLEFCNIFPRRSKLKKDELVNLWIAEGFVKTSCATGEMEDVAEDYIQELVSCSFLQPEIDDSSEEEYFTIHDILHDLLAKVAASVCFRIENTRSHRGEGSKEEFPRDVRHLFVQNYDGEFITKKILGMENLRTLIIDVVEEDTPVEEKVFESICKRLPKLRVLSVAFKRKLFEISMFSVPKSIGQLKHLRYLAFRTPILCTVTLPRALTKLHHIQLLDFGNGEILEFPFAGLVNLRHMFCSPLLLKFPNIGRLSSLQTLPCFTVRNEQGYEINQLRDLNKIRGKLAIYGLENVKSKDEALEANLAAKEGLTELKLGWDTRCSPEVKAEVLEGLCPPVGLESLNIYFNRDSRYPDWMARKQCGGPEDLRNLYLWRCSHLGPGPELKAFPHLHVLHIWYCSWDSLPGNMEHLTLLKELNIEGCKNVRLLPTLPQSVEEFRLGSCNDEFMESCKTAGHPNWQKIEHIPRKQFW